MLTRKDLKELAAHMLHDSPYVSLYLDVDPKNNPKDAWLLHFKNLAKDAVEKQKSKLKPQVTSDIEKIEKYLADRPEEMQRGMAVRRVDLEYLAACFEGDELLVGNWIVANDGRLRATRRFQVINATRGETALRGEILYVCMNLATGRPVRMPGEFTSAYAAVAAQN